MCLHGFATHEPGGGKDIEAMKQIQYWRFEVKSHLPGTLLTACLERGHRKVELNYAHDGNLKPIRFTTGKVVCRLNPDTVRNTTAHR